MSGGGEIYEGTIIFIDILTESPQQICLRGGWDLFGKRVEGDVGNRFWQGRNGMPGFKQLFRSPKIVASVGGNDGIIRTNALALEMDF